MPSSPPNKNASSSPFDAFNEVDKLVSKPVLGSDGAAAWQNFRTQTSGPSPVSVAPKAPLKKSDRAAGFTSWEEERQRESEVREKSGAAPLNAGYTEFKHKQDQEGIVKRKERQRIEKRLRPEDQTYFIGPKETFEGWKFDYIFTTKDRGTGYYWDGMDSLKKLRGQSIERGKQSTSETTREDEMHNQRHSSTDDPSTTTNSGDNEPPKKKKKKKKKRKREGPTIVDDASNPLEQIAAALQRRQGIATIIGQQPTEWETAKDPTSGKTYYYRRDTGERSWEVPAEVVAAAAAKQQQKQQNDLPLGWSETRDPNSGKMYYYHSQTGETRWDRPTNI